MIRELGGWGEEWGEGGAEGSSKGPKGLGFMRDEGISALGEDGEVSVDACGCDEEGIVYLLDDFFHLTFSHLFLGSSVFSFSFFSGYLFVKLLYSWHIFHLNGICL